MCRPLDVYKRQLMEKDNTVRQAGGFIVQLMPNAEEEVIENLEKNLAQITSVTELLDQGLSLIHI